MRLFAPAKLNLLLRITGRRADGYHELQSVLQLLDHGDWLEFETTAGAGVEVRCEGLPIPMRDNLVYRAARALQLAGGARAGCRIRLEKRLPSGGGLGGGSSDAATTLLALNRLWRLGLSRAELARLGLGLGADVPAFVHGRSAWAEGIGERLTAIDLPPRHFVVVAPDCAVSTAEVFARRELTRDSRATTIAGFFERGGANDCQAVVCGLYPEVERALDWLGGFGQAQMTGTGACVFLPVADAARAEAVLAQKPARWRGFAARGINRSPVLDVPA